MFCEDLGNRVIINGKVWKTLIDFLKGIVADEFLFGLKDLGFSPNRIPNFLDINKILKNYNTLKQLSNSPQRVFFQSKKLATCWLRSMSQIDYLEEPDMFHDVFAHVPLLSNEDYTSFFKEIGQIAVEVINDPLKLTMLQRLYWFTIEFGLIVSGDNYKIYGAGIISSREESKNVFSKKSKKLSFDVKKIMNHSFRTDVIQDTYYVIDSFEQLTRSVDEIRKQLKIVKSVDI